MIYLDTNYLIGLLVRGSHEAQQNERWLAAGEPPCSQRRCLE